MENYREREELLLHLRAAKVGLRERARARVWKLPPKPPEKAATGIGISNGFSSRTAANWRARVRKRRKKRRRRRRRHRASVKPANVTENRACVREGEYESSTS